MTGIEILIAAVMFGWPASSGAEPVPIHAFDPADRSYECLALNMYHEARDQGTAGVLAVSAVVFNRINDSRFPNTICEVIEEGPTRASWKDPEIRFPIKNKCQFSWYCDGKSDKPYDKKKYKYLLNLATVFLSKKIPFLDITDGAVFYHADYVRPKWAKTKTKTIEIEDHIFYKWDQK